MNADFKTNKTLAGTLFFIGFSQFIIGMMLAEALYPGYSISMNYISDLGVGPSAIIFNASIFLMGLLILIGTYFFERAFHSKTLTVLLALLAIGAMGVGVFTESFAVMHGIVSLLAFVFGGISAIFSGLSKYGSRSKLLARPFSVIAVILGLMSLGALVLGAMSLGTAVLGVGGMERMIAYPILIWGAGFGGYLIATCPPEKLTMKEGKLADLQ